jgi:Spy/CpxP family protein refolding chaperone
MKLSHFVFRVFTPALLLAMPLSVAAQQAGPVAPGRGQRPGGNGQLGAQGFALGGPVGVLDDQQRASYEAALSRERGLMLELQAKLRIAREDFVAASVDQKFDETAMRQKAMAAYGIEAEMAVLRAKAMSEVQPPLTPEQIQKIKTGQPGPMRPFRQQQQRQLERSAPNTPSVNTNTDINGLPPKK